MEGQQAQPAQPSPALEPYREALTSLLGAVVHNGRFNLQFVVRPFPSAGKGVEDPEWVVDFSGADAELLLERKGELLNALEYVVLRAARLPEELFTKVTFDCKDFRQSRIDELKLMAQVAADRVVETGAPFPLSGMTPRERRVVHLALKERPEVRTESQGWGAERQLVVYPAVSPRR